MLRSSATSNVSELNTVRRSYIRESLRASLPLIILAGGAFAFAAMSSLRAPPPPRETKVGVPLVEGIPVGRHEGGYDIQVDGIVVPHREITLSAEVAGRITYKSPECRAGRYVRAGMLLVEIDPRTYQLELDRLREEVKQAEATLGELDVEISNTEALVALAEEDVALRVKELGRQNELWKQQAASESNVDEARRAELQARNSLATLKNQGRSLESRKTRLTSARDLAQAKAAEAQLNLDKSQVKAPIDGVVVSESVEQDVFVQPGSVLCAIEDTSAVEVRCSLRMEELDWVRRQDPQELEGVAAGPQDEYQPPRTPATVTYRLGNRTYQWEGELWRYEGIGLDERTRTVPCRVLVQNPRRVQRTDGGSDPTTGVRALVRGMFVQVTLHTRPDITLLELPERAVQPGNVVWRVADSRLQVVRLRNLALRDEMVLIPQDVNELRAGEIIVTTPLSHALDGMMVQLQTQPSPQPPAQSRELSDPTACEAAEP